MWSLFSFVVFFVVVRVDGVAVVSHVIAAIIAVVSVPVVAALGSAVVVVFVPVVVLCLLL